MTARKTVPTAGKAFFNPFPKYLQVRQVLERRMASEYELGQQIPTEQALCKEFGVSRETVREALRGLEDDGIVERHRPQGTFLVRRPDRPVTEKLTGLIEDFTALKLDTHARLLGVGMVKAPAEARMVGDGGEEVFCISRLRYFEDLPLVLHEAYLPAAIGPRVAALDLSHSSIGQLLNEKLGIRHIEESQQIEAMVADTGLAQLLGISIGAPVLLVRRFLQLPQHDGMVIFKSYYRADRYRYTLNLVPQASAKPAQTAKKR
jgi:GntR family transcriptional regulator